jgi:hypothetical protein
LDVTNLVSPTRFCSFLYTFCSKHRKTQKNQTHNIAAHKHNSYLFSSSTCCAKNGKIYS